jgi:hypothetical protein
LAAIGVGGELRSLSALLSPGEFVLDVLQGLCDNEEGILVRTTTRLVFFAKGFVSTKVEEFPLDKITSVQYTTGWVYGEVTVFASGNKAEIKKTVTSYTKTFVDGLRSQLDALNKPIPSDASSGSQGGATMAELERLVKMKEGGFLSDEEFAAAKRKILGL